MTFNDQMKPGTRKGGPGPRAGNPMTISNVMQCKALQSEANAGEPEDANSRSNHVRNPRGTQRNNYRSQIRGIFGPVPPIVMTS